jgi:hypothetical protein
MSEERGYDFSGLSDLELVQLQKKMRGSDDPSDKEFLNAILVELGRRQRLKGVEEIMRRGIHSGQTMQEISVQFDGYYGLKRKG